MKILKNIFIFILEIILMIAISAILIINLISSTVLNKQYVLAKFEEIDYYNKIYEYAESNFEKYIYQSGLDESVMQNLITVEQVKQDTQNIIDNIYDNASKSISTEELKKNLRANIENSVDKNSTIKQSALDSFVNTIAEEYKDSVSHTKYEQKINSGLVKISEYIAKLKNICLIAIIIAVVLIGLLNIKTIHKFITNIGVSILASGMFFMFTNIFINLKIGIKNITVLNVSISEVLRNILQEFLSMIMKYGIIMLVTGIVAIVVSILIHNLKNKKIIEMPWKKFNLRVY